MPDALPLHSDYSIFRDPYVNLEASRLILSSQFDVPLNPPAPCAAPFNSLHSDFSIFRDPYVYLKAPPFDKVQLLGVAEGICGINGGFVYVHNALPDGPVAWVFQRVTELPLRWVQAQAWTINLEA